jgi:hypothetical protein
MGRTGTTKTGAGAMTTGLGAIKAGDGTPMSKLKKTFVRAMEVAGTERIAKRTDIRRSFFIFGTPICCLYINLTCNKKVSTKIFLIFGYGRLRYPHKFIQVLPDITRYRRNSL